MAVTVGDIAEEPWFREMVWEAYVEQARAWEDVWGFVLIGPHREVQFKGLAAIIEKGELR